MILRIGRLLVAIVACLTGATGCGRLDSKAGEPINERIDTKQEWIALEQLHAIDVHSTDGDIVSATQRPALVVFHEAIHTAAYSPGQLDIAPPDYVAVAKANGGEQTFLFWLQPEHNGLFVISGQEGHYRLPGNTKKTLLDWFGALTTDADADNEPESGKNASLRLGSAG